MNKKILDDAINICRGYGLDVDSELIIDSYNQMNRYWHTIEHPISIIEKLNGLFEKKTITDRQYNILVIASIFHDIVYDSHQKDNEEKSVDYMFNRLNPKLMDPRICISLTKAYTDLYEVRDIILNTKDHKSYNKFTQIFNQLDTGILDSDYETMLDWENKIRQEYRWVDNKNYKRKRIEFLMKIMEEHKNNIDNILKLVNFVEENY